MFGRVRTNLVLQPFADDEALVEVLAAALANEQYESFQVVVAWARPSGLRHLADHLAAFSSRGGVCEITLGIDEGGATIEGLELALNTFDTASVLYDASGGTFHPKIYLLRGPDEALLIVGSNNLTAGGLYFNYEAASVMALDLGLAPDREVLETIEDFISRLRTDTTCLELTAELIEALATDPQYGVRTELQRDNTRGGEDSVIRNPNADNSLFGSSQHQRKRIKPVAPGRREPAPFRDPKPATLAQSSSVSGDSPAPVEARWSKKMTRSDCGRPREGSNTTGALRFTKAGHPIRQATWFRDVLFSDADWDVDPTRDNRERTSVRFDVQLYGSKLGTHVLALKYDPERDAEQNNFTTDLKWGSLTPVIRSQDLVGSFVVIERLADKTYRMKIEIEQPEDFLDNISTFSS
ncbi:HKD family nuclease [Arthrobacter sp. B3I9]|uniref:phospholipase D family protein n=1 Tax=Arthrobacter sp. B3I9 TaxID=3042270 RepID=UPI0027945DD7|nr:phospholipase D family protein [Arthrobacter sp. B3I9]MDQ0851345.1 HKD family nuclease [Arthrobacter sp. B3I9]